jgi:hypothetical protein
MVNGNMSDRGFLFLFSVLMIAAGGGSAAYLVATGQAGTVDGLFLVLTALLLALVFALNMIYMLNRAMEAAKGPVAPPAKAAAATKPAKPAPVPVSQA